MRDYMQDLKINFNEEFSFSFRRMSAYHQQSVEVTKKPTDDFGVPATCKEVFI